MLCWFQAKEIHSELHKFHCFFVKQNWLLWKMQGIFPVSYFEITPPLVKVHNFFDCVCFRRIADDRKDKCFYYSNAAHDGLKSEGETTRFLLQ